MTRIGMVLDGPFPPDNRVFNEARQLLEHGFEVHLFCLTYAGAQPARETVEGIQVHRYAFKPWVRSISALAHTVPVYDWALRKALASFIAQARPEVLHCHDIQIGNEALRQARRAGLPFVIDLHENRPEIMKHYHHVRTFPGRVLIFPRLWKRAEERLVRAARAVVTVTERAKEELVSRAGVPPERVIPLPNTVRPEFYTQAQIDPEVTARYTDHFVILYLGETGLRRGLLTAIDALPELSARISKVKLVVVGASKTDNVLQDRVRYLGIQRLVDFEGWVHQDRFGSYLKAAAVGISPLHRNPHHDMTLANKLAQYMSFGVPLVASDCTEQVDLVERWKCGLVHTAEDTGSFRDQVLALHGDSELRKRLGENGRKAVRDEFNWDVTSLPLVRLYRELVSG